MLTCNVCKWLQFGSFSLLINYDSRVVVGNKNNPNAVHACLKRRLKWTPSALSSGDINTEACSTRLWLGVRLNPSPCKTTIVMKPQEMQKASLERPGQEPGCSTSMMMMMMMVVVNYIGLRKGIDLV